MWTSVEYALDWPAELLRDEILELQNHPYRPGDAAELERLLREAFHTPVPAEEFARLAGFGEWTEDYGPARNWLRELQANIGELRPYAPPKPYWAARQTPPAPDPPRTAATAMGAFANLAHGLRDRGYFEQGFHAACLYGDPEQHGRDINDELDLHLGPGPRWVWPLRPETWDEDTFFTLLEVLHDLVARPRRELGGSPLEHDGCQPHFCDFDAPAGRRIYRALVNRTLTEHRLELRLADTGEDTGRLVHVVDESRAELVERALATPSPATAGQVAHAIALFRGRTVSVHDKRSAVVTLALVLEERRKLLKAELLSKDEGALFQIANGFALRHQRPDQQAAYDPVFLDWVFWWYLATIELTNRLIARPTP